MTNAEILAEIRRLGDDAYPLRLWETLGRRQSVAWLHGRLDALEEMGLVALTPVDVGYGETMWLASLTPAGRDLLGCEVTA